MASSDLVDLTTGATQPSSGFTSDKVQWLYAVLWSRGYSVTVLTNGVEVLSSNFSGATSYSTTVGNWFKLDKGDVVTTIIGYGSSVTLITYDIKEV